MKKLKSNTRSYLRLFRKYRVLRNLIFNMVPVSVKPRILSILWRLKEYCCSVGGIKFKVTCPDGTLEYGKGEDIDRDGVYEAAMSYKLIDCLAKVKNSDTFIDIGGGYGYYSILASQFVSPDNIHVFEPDYFYAALCEINNNRYCQGRMNLNRLFIGNEVKSNMITLDAYCMGNSIVPNIIKMDIEGWEFYAIDGMLNMLSKYHPVLFIELHERLINRDFRISAAKARDVVEKIERTGYKILYNGHHYFSNTHDGISQKEWTDEPTNNVNYALFCSPL